MYCMIDTLHWVGLETSIMCIATAYVALCTYVCELYHHHHRSSIIYHLLSQRTPSRGIISYRTSRPSLHLLKPVNLFTLPPQLLPPIHTPPLPRPPLPILTLPLPNLLIQHNAIHTRLQQRKHQTRLALQSPQAIEDRCAGFVREIEEEGGHLSYSVSN